MSYTTEENQELLEDLKGKRYYKITLQGYGGEAAYINLSKQAYEFWNNHVDEYGSEDLLTYMLEAENFEDGDSDFENLESVPEGADFMTDDDSCVRPWYEAPNEFTHQYGIEYTSANISVDEYDSEEYDANFVSEVVDYTSFSSMLDTIQEQSDYEIENVDSDEEFSEMGEYVCQFYSSEKGCFFEGVVETIGSFDAKKLSVVITEYPNGEDIVTSVMYDGEDIDNLGGDTNGKGYSVHLWKNEQLHQ